MKQAVHAHNIAKGTHWSEHACHGQVCLCYMGEGGGVRQSSTKQSCPPHATAAAAPSMPILPTSRAQAPPSESPRPAELPLLLLPSAASSPLSSEAGQGWKRQPGGLVSTNSSISDPS